MGFGNLFCIATYNPLIHATNVSFGFILSLLKNKFFMVVAKVQYL
jgi:hypothetical protein